MGRCRVGTCRCRWIRQNDHLEGSNQRAAPTNWSGAGVLLEKCIVTSTPPALRSGHQRVYAGNGSACSRSCPPAGTTSGFNASTHRQLLWAALRQPGAVRGHVAISARTLPGGRRGC